jgi:heme exporter protein D
VTLALAITGLTWSFWLALVASYIPLVATLLIATALVALRLADGVRRVRDRTAALDRARDKGGLAHVVEAERAGNHAGWLTLHHDTGDIGFFSFIGPAQDIYVPRHTVATVGREPDGSTRVTYLGQDIASFVVASKHNNLELWQMPAAEAHSHARTEIPTAVARIRDGN